MSVFTLILVFTWHPAGGVTQLQFKTLDKCNHTLEQVHHMKSFADGACVESLPNDH